MNQYKYIFFLTALFVNTINGMEYQLSTEDMVIDKVNDETTPQMIFDCLSDLEEKMANNQGLSSFFEVVTAHKKIIGSSIVHFLSAHPAYSKVLEYVLQKEANPNEASDLYPSPLFSSIIADNSKATALLVEHGADILVENSNDKTNCMGSNTLLCAVHKYPATENDIKMVQLLLNHKDGMKLVNKKGKTFGEKEYTPLQLLATHAQNIPQDCPLCSATEMCLTEETKKEHIKCATDIKDLLLEKGANP